jgi:hypothetical protein
LTTNSATVFWRAWGACRVSANKVSDQRCTSACCAGLNLADSAVPSPTGQACGGVAGFQGMPAMGWRSTKAASVPCGTTVQPRPGRSTAKPLKEGIGSQVLTTTFCPAVTSMDHALLSGRTLGAA